MWGDWQELVQSVCIGLVFSFLVAKLIATVIAFREDNLQIVREADLPPAEPDSSDISESQSPVKDVGRLNLAGDEAGAMEEKKALLMESDGVSEDDDWEGIESTELDEAFSAATTFVAAAAVDRLSQNVSSDLQLQLYGLYKIATEGPCSAPQPSALRISARAKWNAWQRLGAMPPEQAMHEYIAIVTELYPTWASGSTSKRKEGESETSTTTKETMGPVFSSLVYEEETENDLTFKSLTGRLTNITMKHKFPVGMLTLLRGCISAPKMDAIHAYAREGEKRNILKCIENGIPLNVRDSEGRTPLHWAVDRGQTDIVELLISKSADVNAQDNEGQTALHYAVVCDREAIAEVLVNNNADFDIKDNDGYSPKDLCKSGWLCMQSGN